MGNSTIGIIIFIAGYFGGRVISENALKQLSTEEKGRLVEAFSSYRLLSIAGVVAIVVIYFVVKSLYPNSTISTPPVYYGCLVFYLLTLTGLTFKKLHSINMPESYINRYLLSAFVQYAGIFGLFALVLNN